MEPGSGIALETLRERLAKRFEGRASLSLEPVGKGMRATVRLPWGQVTDATPGETERSAA